MLVAIVMIGVSPNAMAQSGGQKSQSTQSQSTQSSSSNTNSQNPLNDIIGTINTLVNKSPNSSDAQTKSGKTASAGAGKQAANKTASDQPDTDDVGKSLADLKDFYERGLITKPEYDAKRKELLAKIY